MKKAIQIISILSLLLLLGMGKAWATYTVSTLPGQVFITLQEAEAKMRGRNASTQHLVINENATSISATKILLNYYVPSQPYTLGPWKYINYGYYNGTCFSTEQELINDDITRRLDASAASSSYPKLCALVETPLNDWERNSTKSIYPSGCGVYYNVMLDEQRYYTFHYSYDWGNGICSAYPTTGTYLYYRISEKICPTGLTYNASSGICYSSETATITGDLNQYCPGGKEGNPCYPATGDKVQTEQDLITGDLSLSRTFHSLNQYPSPSKIGFGWYANHASKLLLGNNIPYGYLRPDGFIEPLYVKQGTSNPTVYVPATGNRLKLESSINGWILHASNGDKEYYDPTGKLTQVVHDGGATTIYSYNANNQLELVTGPHGEYLRFDYDPTSAYLKTVTDNANRQVSYDYDGNGNLVFVHHSDSTTRQYHYEDPRFPNLLTGITDENNVRFATYGYDGNAKIQNSTHSGDAGRVDITYNADGSATVTNSRGRGKLYYFNYSSSSPIKKPHLIIIGSQQQTFDYYYPYSTNPQLRLQRYTDEAGRKTEYTYDDYNIATQTEAAGTMKARTTSYTYDPRFFSKVATKTEPSVCNGQSKVTTYGHDDFGNTTSIAISGYTPNCTAVSRIATMQYNGPLHQLTQIDGPRTDVNDVTSFDYYPIFAGDVNSGRLASVTLANGTQARYNIHYTPTGKVLSEQRPNGITLTYTYNPLSDRLDYVTISDGVTSRVTAWTYWPSGEVHSITTGATTGNPITLSFDYDDARRLTRITNADGSYLEYKLDTEGNKEQENIYDGGILRKQILQTFDVYNRLATFSQANETRTTHFAPDGTLHDSLDGKNVTSDYHYDDLKRLLSSTADLGGTDPTTQNALTQYDYNVHDDLTKVTDPINGITAYDYDDLGNLVAQNSPDTGPVLFQYDAAGNMILKQDAKGQVFNYHYDALNRLLDIQAPDPAQNVIYHYDTCPNGIGRLCDVMQNGTPVAYQYSAFGEILDHQYIQYHYDDHGRLDTLRYPSGTQLTYLYDPFGKLWRIDASINGVGNVPLASGIQYAAFGPLVTFQYGNGLTMNRIPDSAYRYTDITVPNVLSLTNAQYDGNGNLQSRQESLLLALYTYDALDRLDTASGGFGNRDYNVDKNGNRSSDADGAVSNSYSYRPMSNVLSTINGANVQTDPLGNIMALRGMTLTYDNFNRLSSVTNAVYGYNALNQRVTKLVNGVATTYLYGLNGELLAELDANGVTQNEYYYLNGAPLALTQTTTNTPPPPPADVILDNDTAATTRSSGWTSSTNKQDYGANYRYTAASTTARWYRWTPALPLAGQYDVYAWYVTNTGNSTSAPYTIVHNGATQVVNVNQRVNGGQWVLLGRYDFSAAGGEYVQLSNVNGRVTADAIKFVYVPGVVQAGTQTKLYYLHTDQLGTPRAMTDVNQKVVWRWDSDPFGKGAANDDPDGDGVKVTMNLRFPGQYYDAESGLHYNYHRYYDPQMGRYVSSDPIGLAGGLNTYGYAGGNPISYSDPSGLFLLPIAIPVADYVGTAVIVGGPAIVSSIIHHGSMNTPHVSPVPIPAAVNPNISQPQVCTASDPDGKNKCEDLYEEMRKEMQEIWRRHEAMLIDRCNQYDLAHYAPNPSLPAGCNTTSWVGHKIQIDQHQNILKNLIRQAIRRGCPIIPGAWEAAWLPHTEMPRGYPHGR